MPLAGSSQVSLPDPPYFTSLQELDTWADGPRNELEGTIEFIPRSPSSTESQTRGRLLVCHDYKGGYTESPFALSYTFNFWSFCETFIYQSQLFQLAPNDRIRLGTTGSFSHHRVTVPPSGWINAAHRQGVKILGTLIFENGGEEDCLRLLVGKLPQSTTGPATPGRSNSFPLSPYYARVLAELAQKRGFDGYLLNFECPLTGGVEQTRALAAWITILQSEILKRVGNHGGTIWYDSVVFTGQLAWQDRLNSLNLPFFLSSTKFFTNYTWPPSYTELTTQYFLSLDQSLRTPHASPKSLNDIYMGIDVWGRGSHGGGGFGSYRALNHISPSSLGLSVALFGPAWTWESEQDKPSFTWDSWFHSYEGALWVGPRDAGEIVKVPDLPPPRRKEEPPCEHGPFEPISAFFERRPPPDPYTRTFWTCFSPGVGRAWFVEGRRVFESTGGWTDVDKQCSIGDLAWPRPLVQWEKVGGDVRDGGGDDQSKSLPRALSAIEMEEAWNGGSSLRIALAYPGQSNDSDLAEGPDDADASVYQCVWVPVQSVAVSPNRSYRAELVYKLDNPNLDGVDVDIAFSIKPFSENGGSAGTDKGDNKLEVNPVASSSEEDLPNDWTKLSIQFQISDGSRNEDLALSSTLIDATGLVITTISEDPSRAFELSILLGQLVIYPDVPSTFPQHTPMILWANLRSASPTESAPTNSSFRTLSWETAVSFPPAENLRITSPEDLFTPWKIQPTATKWLTDFAYFNVYAVPWPQNPSSSQSEADVMSFPVPQNAVWIGTSGLDGRRNTFDVVQGNLEALNLLPSGEGDAKIRFFVQGVTDRGVVLPWERCAFVDWIQ